MPACHLEPNDKKALISDVGEELVRTHGKQKYYQPADVERAARKRRYSVDYHCWAYCIFSSPSDFESLHEARGEVCDYAVMKSQVLTELAGGSSFLPSDIEVSWLEWPDLDLSSIFEWFDFS